MHQISDAGGLQDAFPSAPEVVQPRRLLDSGDVAAIASATEQPPNDEELRTSMARERVRVPGHYGVEQSNEREGQLFETPLKRRLQEHRRCCSVRASDRASARGAAGIRPEKRPSGPSGKGDGAAPAKPLSAEPRARLCPGARCPTC